MTISLMVLGLPNPVNARSRPGAALQSRFTLTYKTSPSAGPRLDMGQKALAREHSVLMIRPS